jgi:O-antigen/teichoic acid export membrane protein
MNMISDESVGRDGKARKGQAKFGLEAVMVGASRIAVRGSTFFIGIIIARLLGPEGRGLVAALTVPAALAVSFAEMGIRQATAFYIGQKTYSVDKVAGTLMGLWPIVSILGMALSLAYFNFAHIADGDWEIRLLAVSNIPFNIGVIYVSGILLGVKRIAAFSKASWRPAIINLLCVVIAGWLLDLKIYGVLIANTVGAMVGFIYAVYLLHQEAPLKFNIDWTVAKKLQRLGLNYAASTFLLILNYKIMILLLTKVSTYAQAGLYAQAAAVAELLWEVPVMVSALLFSRAVNAEDRHNFSLKLLSFARLAVLGTALISIGIAIVAPYIFPLIYGQKFAASGTLCILLLPGVVAFIAFRVLQVDINSRAKPIVTMIVILPTLAVNLILGSYLAAYYGATGAAIASSMTYILAAIAYIILYSAITKISLRTMLTYRKDDFTRLIDNLKLRTRKAG